MALITCPECGKEVSDKSSICIYCGFPLKEDISQDEVKDFLKKKGLEPDNSIDAKLNHENTQGIDCDKQEDNSAFKEMDLYHSVDVETQAQPDHSVNTKQILSGLLIAVIAVVVIIVVLETTVLKKNVFSEYVDLLGQSYREIPGEYEVIHVADDFAIARVSPVEIFGVPGEIEYYVFYDEDMQDYGDIAIVAWRSTNEYQFTDEEVETFLGNMIDTFGEYESKQFEEAEYWFSTDETVYGWEGKDNYVGIFMRVYEDMSEISVSFG